MLKYLVNDLSWHEINHFCNTFFFLVYFRYSDFSEIFLIMIFQRNSTYFFFPDRVYSMRQYNHIVVTIFTSLKQVRKGSCSEACMPWDIIVRAQSWGMDQRFWSSPFTDSSSCFCGCRETVSFPQCVLKCCKEPVCSWSWLGSLVLLGDKRWAKGMAPSFSIITLEQKS